MSRKEYKNNKVYAHMVLKGITYDHFAEKLGVSRITVAVVAAGFEKSQRIQEAISRELGIPISELWPDQEEPKAVNE
jgi:lambda repressor-like predicted transcriptional regulator